MPITSISLYSISSFGVKSLITAKTENSNTLELYVANILQTPNDIFTPGDLFIDVYEALNLTKFLTEIDASNTSFVPITSQNGGLTVYAALLSNYVLPRGFFQLIFRDQELHAANCNNANNLNWVFPYNKSFVYEMTAENSGNCLLTILPAESTVETINSPINSTIIYISILKVLNLKFKGEGIAKVVIGYNETYELFSFSSNTATYWNDTIIYGNMISFIIPPSGQLFVECESLNSISNQIQVSRNLYKKYKRVPFPSD
jgi:hypothetical protein